MNKTKNNGITLVALVITIIILLILAGITISQLTGSGLFENAKLAEQKSKEAQEKEDGILGDYENKIGQYVDGTREVNNNTSVLWEYTDTCDIINLSDSLNKYEKIEIYISGYGYGSASIQTYDTSLITENSILNLYMSTIVNSRGWNFVTQYTVTNFTTLQYRASRSFTFEGENNSNNIKVYKIVGINKKN